MYCTVALICKGSVNTHPSLCPSIWFFPVELSHIDLLHDPHTQLKIFPRFRIQAEHFEAVSPSASNTAIQPTTPNAKVNRVLSNIQEFWKVNASYDGAWKIDSKKKTTRIACRWHYGHMSAVSISNLEHTLSKLANLLCTEAMARAAFCSSADASKSS